MTQGSGMVDRVLMSRADGLNNNEDNRIEFGKETVSIDRIRGAILDGTRLRDNAWLLKEEEGGWDEYFASDESWADRSEVNSFARKIYDNTIDELVEEDEVVGRDNLVGAAQIAEAAQRDNFVADELEDHAEDPENLAREAYSRRVEWAHKIASGNLGEGTDTDFTEFEGDYGEARDLFLEAAAIADEFDLSEHRDPFNNGRYFGESEKPRRMAVGALRMAYDAHVQAKEEKEDDFNAKQSAENFRLRWGLAGELADEASYRRFKESLNGYREETDLARNLVEEQLQDKLPEEGNVKFIANLAGEYRLDDLKNDILDRSKPPTRIEGTEEFEEALEKHHTVAEKMDVDPAVTEDDYSAVYTR